MASVHYFQRYSQKENVATNNTLLLFSRFYQYNHFLFEIFLNELFSEDVPNLAIGLQIEQQKKIKKGSVPDGFIIQESFKIVIETKRNDGFTYSQLEAHLNSFKNETKKILLLLSPEKSNPEVYNQIKSTILSHHKGVKVVNTTFEKIIKIFQETISENRDFDMIELIEDYAEYCAGEHLLPTWKYSMRARTAGYSMDLNFTTNLYYDLASRGYRKHKYFALYKEKAIRGVGEIENIIVADYVDGEWKNLESDLDKKITDSQKDRILKSMHLGSERYGDNIFLSHRFFLVKEFYETFYEKKTLYPIQKSKYFNLKERLRLDDLPSDVAEIADLLKAESW